METKPELNDIQGLLARGYGDLKEARYVMIQFTDVVHAKGWLGSMSGKISTAAIKEETFALQIAFTYQGIMLMLNEIKFTQPFSREFSDGMITDVRKKILGDLYLNDPAKWDWGANKNEEIHAVLMLYAKDENELNLQYQKIENEFSARGIKEIIKLNTSGQNTDHKEHFGFVDGVSQPLIKGFEKKESITNATATPQEEFNNIMPGEFILGYENEYKKTPFSPTYADGNSNVDIGKNGSYMVFRQLEQDVKGFWNFVKDTATGDPHFKPGDEIYIASKMYGRFPNGNPLTLKNNPSDDPLDKNEINNFLYKKNDPDGFGCPVGSHIRKTNPRDGIDTDAVVSIEVAKRHRILRRGRSYGEPLDAGMNPEKMMASTNKDKRGLYFICFNANIARQFEFIQQAWANNPKFDGLDYDIDPIIGYTYHDKEEKLGTFTIQACPVRKKVNNIPQFVFVKGGAYFFMPGIAALKFIASS